MTAVAVLPTIALICPPEHRADIEKRIAAVVLPYTIQILDNPWTLLTNAANAVEDELRLYDPAETAVRLGWNETTLRRKAGKGEIPSTKSGRYLMFSETDIKQIIKMSARPVKSPGRRRRRAAA